MEKLKTFSELREELLGATDGEERDMRNEVLNDVADKVNEIVAWINKK